MHDDLLLREYFPLLTRDPDFVYLDSAATTQKPDVVITQMSDFYKNSNANVHRANYRLSQDATTAFEQARQEVAAFIGAASEEIIWTKGATEGLNLLAYGLCPHLQPGDEILISIMEHHANFVPWQQLAKQYNLVLRIIPLTVTAELDYDVALQLITPRTRVVSLTQLSNALGYVPPIQNLIAAAKRVGAITVIDGAQAIAHQRVDVKALDCDFYVFSGHKLYGPTGIGVLYGKYAALDSLPVWQMGGEMIHRVTCDETHYNRLPFRLEAGTPPIAQAIGLGAALGFLTAQNFPALLAHERAVMAYLIAGLKKLPHVTIIGDYSEWVGAVSIQVDGIHWFDVGTFLDSVNIAARAGQHCAMPLMQALGMEGTVRMSVGIYTTFNDIDRVLVALTKIGDWL